jgi:hypothetical protein
MHIRIGFALAAVSFFVVAASGNASAGEVSSADSSSWVDNRPDNREM